MLCKHHQLKIEGSLQTCGWGLGKIIIIDYNYKINNCHKNNDKHNKHKQFKQKIVQEEQIQATAYLQIATEKKIGIVLVLELILSSNSYDILSIIETK